MPGRIGRPPVYSDEDLLRWVRDTYETTGRVPDHAMMKGPEKLVGAPMLQHVKRRLGANYGTLKHALMAAGVAPTTELLSWDTPTSFTENFYGFPDPHEVSLPLPSIAARTGVQILPVEQPSEPALFHWVEVGEPIRAMLYTLEECELHRSGCNLLGSHSRAQPELVVFITDPQVSFLKGSASHRVWLVRGRIEASITVQKGPNRQAFDEFDREMADYNNVTAAFCFDRDRHGVWGRLCASSRYDFRRRQQLYFKSLASPLW